MAPTDRIRVVRVLVIEGERAWVQQTLDHCSVSPGRPVQSRFGVVREIGRTTATTVQEEARRGE